jgi:hypothetical protein
MAAERVERKFDAYVVCPTADGRMTKAEASVNFS